MGKELKNLGFQHFSSKDNIFATNENSFTYFWREDLSLQRKKLSFLPSSNKISTQEVEEALMNTLSSDEHHIYTKFDLYHLSNCKEFPTTEFNVVQICICDILGGCYPLLLNNLPANKIGKDIISGKIGNKEDTITLSTFSAKLKIVMNISI
jgi:hypothetical protein